MKKNRIIRVLFAVLALAVFAGNAYTPRSREPLMDGRLHSRSRQTGPGSLTLPEAASESAARQRGSFFAQAAADFEEEPAPGETEAENLSPLPDAWFDDAVVFGDSISVTLKKHCEKNGLLGDALFLCQHSFSIRDAVSGKLKIWYEGKEYMPEEVVPLTGAGKIFIMLGVNDVALYGGVDRTMACWNTFVDRVHEAAPEVTIFIESCLPVYYTSEFPERSNAIIDGLNERLRALCEEKDCVYVDIAHYFKDEHNGLAAEYCSDEYVHITYPAAQLWVDQLREPSNYSVDPRSLT